MTAKGENMEIYDVLKKDHEKIQNLLSELVALDAKSSAAGPLIEQIRNELVPHSRAEEAIFYNSIRPLKALEGMLKDSYPEHVLSEALLRTLQVEVRMGLPWRATAERLQETLEHHIREEEHQMFTAAKLYFRPEEAREMAKAFNQLKKEVREENLVQTTLELIANVAPANLATTFGKYNLGSRLDHN